MDAAQHVKKGIGMGARGSTGSGKLDFSEVDRLVQELTKENPDEARIEALMTNVGLAYQIDPVQRMSALLDVLNGDPGAKKTSVSKNNRSDREESL